MTRFNPNRLYKNTRDGRGMRGCAGIADYVDIKASLVRFLTIIAGFISGFFPVVFVYVLMGFVLEDKPAEIIEDPEEDRFWREARTKPDYTKADLNTRFEDIEKRTRDMEAYMTSRQFRLQRELRELED